MPPAFGKVHLFWDGAEWLYVLFTRRHNAQGDVWDSRHVFASVRGGGSRYLGSIFPPADRAPPGRGLAAIRLPAKAKENIEHLEIWDSIFGEPRPALRIHLLPEEQKSEDAQEAPPAGRDATSIRTKLDFFISKSSGEPDFHVAFLPAWNEIDEESVHQLDFFRLQVNQLLLETATGTMWEDSSDGVDTVWLRRMQSIPAGQRHVVEVMPQRVPREVSGENITAFQQVVSEEGWLEPSLALLFEGPADDGTDWVRDTMVFTISHSFAEHEKLRDGTEPVFERFKSFILEDRNDPLVQELEQIDRPYSLYPLSSLVSDWEEESAGKSVYVRAHIPLTRLAPGDRFGLVVRPPAQIRQPEDGEPQADKITEAVVFRYLVGKSLGETLTRETLSLDDNSTLKTVLNKATLLLNSISPDSVPSEAGSRGQHRLLAEAADLYGKALAIDPAARQQIGTIAPGLLHDLVASRRLASDPPELGKALLDAHRRAPGLFRFAHLRDDWVRSVAKSAGELRDDDDLFSAVWNLALPETQPPGDEWSTPAAMVGFLDLTRTGLLDSLTEKKLLPAPDILDPHKVERLLEHVDSAGWLQELNKAKAGSAGMATLARRLSNEWVSLKEVDNAATALESQRTDNASVNRKVEELFARFPPFPFEPAVEAQYGSREDLITELLRNWSKGLSETEAQQLSDAVNASDLEVLQAAAARLNRQVADSEWPTRAAEIIRVLEEWSGLPDFATTYMRLTSPVAAVNEFVGFRLQKWPRESAGALLDLRNALDARLRTLSPHYPVGHLKIDQLVRYADVLAYSKVARQIDEIIARLNASIKMMNTAAPKLLRGISTVSSLRQTFPYGAGAAVTRLEQLLDEMQESGDPALKRLARRNQLDLSLPDFATAAP